MSIGRQTLLESLPPEWPEALLPRIQAAVRASRTKLVVLDDDPTGSQTVHDVDVLTSWSVPVLAEALDDPAPVVYVLTNTRSMPLSEAQDLNRVIARNLGLAQATSGRHFAIVSRSDSTLRGHYPGETAALAEALGVAFDATLIVPFFPEGGRVTANNIHYVTEGERLTPVGSTEYAQDATFGYTSSDLRAWVSEKHGVTVQAEDVVSITLDDIRTGGPAAVTRKLVSLHRRADKGQSTIQGIPCVVNAVSYRDLEVVVAGILDAEVQGCRLLYRTAASFVRVRGGITPRALLTRGDLASPDPAGGLVIVGSHVRKTTRQMHAALERREVVGIELPVPDLLNATGKPIAVAQAARIAAAVIDRQGVALVFTSREVVPETDTRTELQIGQLISGSLVDVVRQIERRPGWIIAKGGITSSDVATAALGVRRARVLGQAIPGIPVWRTGTESRWPGLPYVVFPGNVGDDQALAQMIELLR